MNKYENTGVLLVPTRSHDWVGPMYDDIPYIPGLEVDTDNYRYVNQGVTREVIIANEAINSLGSDGFSRCSGLVIRDKEAGTVTVAHVEPRSSSILEYLEKNKKGSVRDVALFYGSLSVRNAVLENLISENYFGPMQLATANFESGECAWGMVYNRISDEVKIFTREPTQSITTYSL